MKIVQVVGFQNSGKTTLVEKLIRFYEKKGQRVGSVKHHGHGGEPDLGVQKDSSRHVEAGSLVSTVEGEGAIQLTSTLMKWNVYKILALYQFMQMETVIIEGYKRKPFPKIVLIKRKEDLCLLKELTNIKAIVYWESLQYDINEEYPMFAIDDPEGLCQWLWKEVEMESEKIV